MALASAILVLLASATGCTTVVRPPTAPRPPRPVYLLDEGAHASLVVTRASAALVRYSYGDWAYYALGDTGLLSVLAVVFTATPATLGRRELPASGVGGRAEHVYELSVPAARADALLARLDDEYERHAATKVESGEHDLTFVRLDQPYSLLHDSNAVVADWLTELGCDVSGRPVWSTWDVEPPR